MDPQAGRVLLARRDHRMPLRLAESVRARDSHLTTVAEFHRWFIEAGTHTYATVERVPLAGMDGWRRDPVTGNIQHHSGRFFSVEGLDVHVLGGPVERWHQPIIRQPEIGILGILVKEFDGVLHLLMQAKVEPGNCDGIQLAPTVQATRSNYTRVHRGKAVPYLEYFRDTSRHRVLADVCQSEQGSWFDRKRNRNMVVEIVEDVEVLDSFRWLTLGQVHQLLALDDIVNMDARTVLSCLPFSGVDLDAVLAGDGSRFGQALIRSCDETEGNLHSTEDILSWITGARTRHDVHTARIPLNRVRGWRHTEEKICHETGRFFDVIGVSVVAGGREVGHWTQPMIEPYRTGVVALLVREFGGVLHALMHARIEPGYVDVIELAPTVQGTPENYDVLPSAARPRFLDEVLSAPPERIRFDTFLSEEGGRFYHALNRYLIVQTDVDIEPDSPDFRWMTLHQLVGLLRHSHYLNVQARSLIACLHSLSGNHLRA